jgi:Ca-activated chloride channel family protein
MGKAIMSFAEPHYLMMLLAVPLLALLAILVAFKKRRVTARMGEAPLLARLREGYSPDRRVARLGITLAALSFAAIAAARPQAGLQLRQGASRGMDLIIAVDVSASMLAEDVKPDRLGRAKGELKALLEDLKGDRVGIVAFAGSATAVCPLTSDNRAAAMFLDGLNSGVVSEPGTDLGEAVERSLMSFDSAPDRSRAIVIVTDGEDHEGAVGAAAKKAGDAGVSVYCVGVGGEAGEPIPIEPGGGAKGYRRDSHGEVVLTRMNAGVLRDLASAAGGSFHTLGPSGGSLSGLSKELEDLPRTERSEQYSGRTERFYLPALVSLCLLAVTWFVSDRGRAVARRGGIALVAAMIASVIPSQVCASTTSKGAALYEKGDYSGALARFKEELAERPGAPLRYDCGNALYRLKKFNEAAAQYQGSLSEADSSLAPFARYNMGNSLYQVGDMKGAVGQYIEALKLNPEDIDAKHNLELALRQLKQNKQSSAADSSGSEKNQENSQSGKNGDEQQQGQEGKEDLNGQRPQEGQKPESEPQQKGEQQERGTFSKEEAERLLEALGADEKDLVQRQMKAKVRRRGVEKDW